ncbi:MAG TPA: ATP-binding protein [Polyangiaceae bacterium]|nr:ATP-binding protein [Polyangiaceae bacterium]
MTSPGLRVQILLLLGALLLVTFIPLHFAVATYTEVALRQQRESDMRLLGRALAAKISEQRADRSPSELRSLLATEVARSGVEALGVFDPAGNPLARVGDPELIDQLGAQRPPSAGKGGKPTVFEMVGSQGPALAVTQETALGSVVAVLRVDREATRIGPLVSLIALYMTLIAGALLLLAYLALTRFIIRPLDRLAQAAERVAGGARQFDPPPTTARELNELARSVKQMTENLLSEESALRIKITEVEQATLELRQAQDHLVRSERLASVGRLAAGLAHEVGNPIAAIMGMQDLLLEGGLTPAEQRDFLTRMHKETERINSILRNLLQFARPGSAPVEVVPTTPGDLKSAIEDTLALLTPQKALSDIAVSMDIPPALSPVLLGREHILQVMLNLLLNAADACSGRPNAAIRIRASQHAGSIVLQVEDTGPGIDPKVLDRLYEPFVTTKEVGHGTGLGLAVCRGLIEGVGGSIALDRDYTEGARFVIVLPTTSIDSTPNPPKA